jgi:hypothetical protein
LPANHLLLFSKCTSSDGKLQDSGVYTIRRGIIRVVIRRASYKHFAGEPVATAAWSDWRAGNYPTVMDGLQRTLLSPIRPRLSDPVLSVSRWGWLFRSWDTLACLQTVLRTEPSLQCRGRTRKNCIGDGGHRNGQGVKTRPKDQVLKGWWMPFAETRLPPRRSKIKDLTTCSRALSFPATSAVILHNLRGSPRGALHKLPKLGQIPVRQAPPLSL